MGFNSAFKGLKHNMVNIPKLLNTHRQDLPVSYNILGIHLPLIQHLGCAQLQRSIWFKNQLCGQRWPVGCKKHNVSLSHSYP